VIACTWAASCGPIADIAASRRIGIAAGNGDSTLVSSSSRDVTVNQISVQPSRSGRWAPLTSPHRPVPSVAIHRSGSSRSRNSSTCCTCHAADSRTT
jgi:hypothetical protein